VNDTLFRGRGLTRFFAVAIAIVVLATAVGLWHWRQRSAVQSVERYGDVPDFALVDRTGRTVTRRDFLDRVSVVDFFYTRCTDACPLQGAQMALLQARYAAARRFQLVSITVDPDHDDPAGLATYARSLGADPTRWLFLTGRREVIYRLAVDAFHLAVVAARRAPFPSVWASWQPAVALAHERTGEPRIIQLAHGSQFAVVDRRARIVGYFDSFDPGQRQALQNKLDRWLR